MPQQRRLLNPSQPTTYHCISRSTLPGLPMGDIEKETLVQMIQQFSRLYFIEIIGYTAMDTHFHLVARMLPETDFSDKDIIDRYESFWGDLSEFSKDWIPGLRKKWANLSEFISVSKSLENSTMKRGLGDTVNMYMKPVQWARLVRQNH